ncbi:MAG TPA: spermidine synthase, partial [Vicinamibacteria bacterium]
MSQLLYLVFFVSGAAALLFETLWFRQTGLVLGNSIWASSLVTSSLMGGLAIGNALAARRGGHLRRPIRTYALLEAIIGATGLGLVCLLPRLTTLLVPIWTGLGERPALLNAMRLFVAFAVLLVPATSMGATLPVLTRAVSAHEPSFGRVLGSLYGLNTLGAVAGALVGEAWLIERFGITGTGLCAAGLNLSAAAAALALSRDENAVPYPVTDLGGTRVRGGAGRLVLGAAFLAGAILLSLEVVWFRLLLMFVFASSLSFAVMLAVVLAGIGLGGLAAGRVLRAGADPRHALPSLALALGAVTAWTYAALPDVLSRHVIGFIVTPRAVLGVALPLMLPTSVLSGALFTLMGTVLKKEGRGASAATGALTLANTTGAMLGPLVTAFLLLPGIGVERTLYALAMGYGAVALLCAGRRGAPSPGASRWTLARWT